MPMPFFSQKNQTIQIGDRFMKTGSPSDIWEVSKVWDTPDGVKHARLVSIRLPNETKAISVKVLDDINFFIPI